MSSKMMIRSCASSTIRTLIHRHLRPTVAASINIQKETPASIYNWHYLLPNSFVPRPVNFGEEFGSNTAGCLVMEEAARGRLRFEAGKENKVEEDSIYEDDDTDFREIEHPIFEDFDEDEDEHEDEEDDSQEIDDD